MNKLLDYTEALEATNEMLVIALKSCLELLAHVPPEVANKEGWQGMVEDLITS